MPNSVLPARSTLPVVEPLGLSLTPVDVWQRLLDLPNAVFFDSALRHDTLGRYSFVAADPFAWLEVPADGSDALGQLDAQLARFGATTVAGLPPFQGGAAGLLSYELGNSLENIPRPKHDEFRMPALAIGLYDVVVAFDHKTDDAWIISQGFPAVDAGQRTTRATERLALFRATLAKPAAQIERAPAVLPDADKLAPQFPVEWQAARLTSNFSAEAYRRAIRRAIEYIHAGDVFQVNLSQRLLHPATSSATELYLRLRERNAAPQAGFFDGGSFQVCSASPERFVAVRNAQIETRPIKGTRGRSASPEADLFAGDDLRLSDKDRAENVMIVDLLRNDLSRVCLPASVCVQQLCELETFAYVQHLVSSVTGRLRPNCSAIDALRATFPGGSITGAPKIRAMEIIAELEPTARGAYCGALAYIGFDGTMDSSILIRTITAAAGWWQLPVGGGIVAQSNPVDEYHETWHKAEGMLRALLP